MRYDSNGSIYANMSNNVEMATDNEVIHVLSRTIKDQSTTIRNLRREIQDQQRMIESWRSAATQDTNAINKICFQEYEGRGSVAYVCFIFIIMFLLIFLLICFRKKYS